MCYSIFISGIGINCLIYKVCCVGIVGKGLLMLAIWSYATNTLSVAVRLAFDNRADATIMMLAIQRYALYMVLMLLSNRYCVGAMCYVVRLMGKGLWH